MNTGYPEMVSLEDREEISEYQEEAWSSLNLRCELLRTCVWVLTDYGRQPVRTARITNLALSIFLTQRPEADPEATREELLENLEELGLAGDLSSFRGGFWLPTPLRRVQLPNGPGEGLLVGGLPIRVFPRELRPFVRAHGTTRRIQSGNGAEIKQWQAWMASMGVEATSYEDWLGAPRDSLSTWGRQVMASECNSFSESPGMESATYAYLPGNTRAGGRPKWQKDRWGPLPLCSPTQRLLVRKARIAEFRPDFLIAEVENGKVLAVSDPLEGGDWRRLMYYLDKLAGAPTAASLETVLGRKLLELHSELPPAEVKLLGALGTLQANPDGSYYPRRWQLDPLDAELIKQMLTELGVSVVTR